jgi:hypothetical protein
MLLSMLNVTPEEAAEKGVSIGGTVMPLNRVTAGQVRLLQGLYTDMLQVNAFTVAKRHGAVVSCSLQLCLGLKLTTRGSRRSRTRPMSVRRKSARVVKRKRPNTRRATSPSQG